MTTIKDAPVINKLTGSEKFPISDGSGKPVTATIQQILNKVSNSGGIPVVEELDPDASIGSVVCYKQTVRVDNIETVTKIGSIRDLNQNLEWDGNSMPNFSNLDIIPNMNFKMPSSLPNKDLSGGFWLGNINMGTQIEVGCYDNHYYTEALDPMSGEWITLLNDEIGIQQSNIKWLEDLLGSEIYYLGTGYPDQPLTEEQFDLIDQFFTFTSKETIKTTEDIVKVIPFVKQENNWESLYTTNSDFNNDFNFDFD